LFYETEALCELFIRSLEAEFGVDSQMPAQIDYGKEQIAYFFPDAFDITSISSLGKFLNLFVDFGEKRRNITGGPVETDLRRPFLYLKGPHKGRKAFGNT
jgi:hypothetical protein